MYTQNMNVLVAQECCQWFPPCIGTDRVSEMGMVRARARAFTTDLRGAKLELLLTLKPRVTTYTTLHGTDL